MSIFVAKLVSTNEKSKGENWIVSESKQNFWEGFLNIDTKSEHATQQVFLK